MLSPAARQTVAAAVHDGMSTVAAAVAAGRTPDGLPAAGSTARGARRRLTAQHFARHGYPPADVWNLYTAALLADDVEPLPTVPAAVVVPVVAVRTNRAARRVDCRRPRVVVVAVNPSNAPPALWSTSTRPPPMF